MKLISLNIEGKAHTEKVANFIAKEVPDVLCLVEAPEDFQTLLHQYGYNTTFAPMRLHEQNSETFPEGVLFASKLPHHAEIFYYHGTGSTTSLYDKNNIHATIDRAVIIGQVNDVTIATTHFTWTPQGEVVDEHQTTHLTSLLKVLEKQPPHILCGDFNIPRKRNALYDVLLEHYIDNIPSHYESSLDRTLHRHGNDPELQFLFDTFMVDYIFSQPPYTVTETLLTFGVSDHAAVTATISPE